jgi:hypothetical protein
MKTKLILGLTLVLSSGIMLTSRAEAQSTDVPPASTNSVILTNSETTSLTPWIAETNCLYFWKDSALGMVSGKQSIYQFQFSPGHPIDLPVSVFVDNKTGRFWAGRRANLYVETDAGIFGLCLPLDGYLRFDASLILPAGGAAPSCQAGSTCWFCRRRPGSKPSIFPKGWW